VSAELDAVLDSPELEALLPDPVEARLAPGRMRTYRGEDRARLTCPAPPLDGTLEAAQAYVDRIVRSAWWKRTCRPSWLGVQSRYVPYGRKDVIGRILVDVHRGGSGRAHTGARFQYRGKWLPKIRLGVQGRVANTVDGWTGALVDPYVVLHEVAHLMAAAHCDDRDDREGGSHGRVFRWYMLALVKRWLGPEHARALREGYKAEGLKVSLPANLK
jgi:hypothetical protein